MFIVVLLIHFLKIIFGAFEPFFDRRWVEREREREQRATGRNRTLRQGLTLYTGRSLYQVAPYCGIVNSNKNYLVFIHRDYFPTYIFE